MINISKNGNAIKFAFTDSDHYLYGSGEIEVPVNSLSLIVDESNMVTMRKANSNDIFLSFDPANSNLSDKAGVIDFYKTQMVGSTGGSESGITSGDVETMIDAALTDYYTDDEVDAALSGKVDASDVTEEISAAVSGKADTSAVTAVNNALTAHTADTGIHVSQLEKDAWNAKLDASAYTPTDLSQYWTSAQTQTAIDGVKAYYVNFTTLTTQGIHDADWDGLVAAINARRPIYAGFGDRYYTAECLYQDGGNRIIMTASDSEVHYFYTFTKNGSENYDFAYVTRPYVTDAEKTAWNAKLDASAYTPVDLSEYWTSAQTEVAISAATSGKADTSAVTAVENEITVLGDALAGKANTAALTAHTSDTDIHVTQADKTSWNAKAEPYSAGTGIEISGNVISTTGGGALFVDFDDLMNNMNDDKWDELVNALQNNKPIFYSYDYSEGDTTDAGQNPVNGYVYINETEGEESTEIGLNRMYSGGWIGVVITKNGSEDYEVASDGFDYQPYGEYQEALEPGSGISIDGNVISVTGGTSVTVDPTLDSGSTNPVANSAITTAIDTKAELSNTVTDVRVYDTLYGRGLQKKVGNGGYSTILYYGKINDTNIVESNRNYISNFQLVEKSSITSAITSASTNAEVAGAKAVYDAIQAAGGGGGGSVTVDSELDTTSSNPVENQAIAQAIDDTNAEVDTKADQSEMYYLLDGSTDENDPVNPVRLMRISQSDYDDLANGDGYDPDVLYIITPDEENEGGNEWEE